MVECKAILKMKASIPMGKQAKQDFAFMVKKYKSTRTTNGRLTARSQAEHAITKFANKYKRDHDILLDLLFKLARKGNETMTTRAEKLMAMMSATDRVLAIMADVGGFDSKDPIVALKKEYPSQVKDMLDAVKAKDIGMIIRIDKQLGGSGDLLRKKLYKAGLL